MRFILGLLAALSFMTPALAQNSTVAAMTAAGAITGPELFYCVQSGADRKCTPSQILTYISSATKALTNTDLTSGTNTFPTFNQNTTGTAASATSFTGSLVGDVTGLQGATSVVRINGQALSALSTGILKNTTATGVPTIAVVGTDYQAPVSLTTTGTSGAATFIGNTLNVPQYAAATPGGSSGQIQYNNAGAFGGVSTLAWADPALSIGLSGSGTGQLKLLGNTSGTVTITPQAAAGTATFTLPNASGTPVISVPSPLTTSATTGATSWSVTGAGRLLAATSSTAVSATATPTLGVAGSVVGTMTFANATSGSITLQPVTGALGTTTLIMPGTGSTDTIATLAANQTWSGANTYSVAGGVTMNNGIFINAVRNTGGLSLPVLGVNSGTDVLRIAGVPDIQFWANGAQRGYMSDGWQIGSPTGGDKGAGTINIQSGIYANNVVGISGTRTVRAAGGASDCTLVFTMGLLTGGTC